MPKRGSKKRLGRQTVRSSNRKRAALAGQSDKVLPGKRKRTPSVIQADSEQEVFGVLLSERRRMGESTPAVPAKKVQSTASLEPKAVPKTGVAKNRKTS